MRVSGAIKSVIHGVTTNNLLNAASAYFDRQTNTIPRVDEGLTKRPPTEVIANIGATLGTGEFVKRFTIHDVAYFVVFRKSPLTLTVHREDGEAYTVTDIAGDTYLDNITKDTCELTVHGELVFILNTSITTKMIAASDSYPKNSLLYIKGIMEVGATVTVSAVNSSNSKITKSHVVVSGGTDPAAIAFAIAALFNAEADWTANSSGQTAQFVRSDGEWSQVTAVCDSNQELVQVMNGEVDEFSDLPRIAYFNCRQTVKPQDAPEGTEVYMKAVPVSYKDEETAVADPVPVFSTADTEDLTFKWRYWNGSSYTYLTGNPTTRDREYTLALYNPTSIQYQWGATGYLFTDIICGIIYQSTGDPFDINAVYPRWWINWVTGAQPGVDYGAKHTVRFALPATPQTTEFVTTLEGNEITPGLDPLWQNYGGWSVPYGPNDPETWFPFPTVDTLYDIWIEDLGTLPATNTSLVQVKWIETAANDLTTDPDRSTLPHLLSPVDSETFSYQAPNWIDRKAGDNVSNPLPAFIGSTINDLTIFQNRLAVLSKDVVTMSSTDDVFNFFRGTVTQLLSSHPVSIRSTSTQSARLNYFVYHNRDLMITTAKQQYKISGEAPITPQTASMQLTATYNASESVAPVSIGNSVYIPNHHGVYLNLNKYEGSNENLEPDDADNITQHVRKYVDGTVDMLAGSPNHGLLFAAATGGQDIFVCNYDTEKSRREAKRYAWFKWNDLSDDTGYEIRSIETVKNTLLIAIETTQGLNLVKMDLDAGEDKKYLDYQLEFTGVNTTVNVGTTYGVTESGIKVVQGTGCPSPGDYVGVTSLAAGVLTLDTDMAGGAVTVGREFLVDLIPNLLTVRDEGDTVNKAANLRIRKFILSLVNTGSLEATETSPHDTYPVQEFSGLVTNDLETITGTAARTEEDFKVGFKQHADVGKLRITSTSWLPMTIAQIDWVGNYTTRGRRF